MSAHLRQTGCHEPGIRSRPVDVPRPVPLAGAGRCARQRAMPQVGETAAALVALRRLLEYLLRLHIHETQPHGAVAQNALQMPQAAASTEPLLGIERDHAMAGLPDAVDAGIAAESQPRAERPYANHLAALISPGRDAASQPVSRL